MRICQDGCRRAAPGRREDKERQRLGRDIDNGDGTVDGRQQDINDRKVLGTSWGTKTENHSASKTMTKTKLADTEVKETIAKGRESGVMTNDQLKKIIKGILGEEGRDMMYKDGGAGLSKTVKGRGAELGETVKGKGGSRGQDTGDIDGSYS